MLENFASTTLLLLINTIVEFLPVSSTAHGILISKFFSIGCDTKLLFAISQLAIDLVLCLHFRKLIGQLIGDFFFDRKTRLFCYNMFLTSLPFLVVGLLFHRPIRKYLYSDSTIILFLIAGGIFLILTERYLGRKTSSPEEPDSLGKIKPAIMYKIGLIQVLSILPGVSRSACTIGGALILGLARKTAVDFSFFISIPVGVAGSFFDIFREITAAGASDYHALAGYFIVSMIFALFFVKRMLNFLRLHGLGIFGYYRVALGIMILVLFGR
jgi:undecaprenyl-diphosphatase